MLKKWLTLDQDSFVNFLFSFIEAKDNLVIIPPATTSYVKSKNVVNGIRKCNPPSKLLNFRYGIKHDSNLFHKLQDTKQWIHDIYTPLYRLAHNMPMQS